MKIGNVGENIRNLRRAKGMTQDALAKASDTTSQTIYKYEKNIVTNIPLSRLEKIAKALNTTAIDLIGFENDEPSNAEFEVSYKSPVNSPLSKNEEKMLRLFREIPDDKKNLALEMLRVVLKSK